MNVVTADTLAVGNANGILKKDLKKGNKVTPEVAYMQ